MKTSLKVLLRLMLLALPAVVQAQFSYTTNNGAITITGYTGSIKLSLKSLIAFLCIASASLVGAQTLQTLCSFNGTNGAMPMAALTLGTDGNFYGTTGFGSGYGYGTVFKVTTNGTLTTLFSFKYLTVGNGPVAALTLGTDGNFYGTTCAGGCYYDGRDDDRETAPKSPSAPWRPGCWP